MALLGGRDVTYGTVAATHANIAIPMVPERKGSMLLRSDHAEYTLSKTATTGWHQAREAEPRDYKVEDHVPEQDLHQSTYHRFGGANQPFPMTTAKELMADREKLPDFTERDAVHSMVNQDNFTQINFERKTNAPERGFGSVLPHHPDGHNRHHLNTTYSMFYQQPHPEITTRQVEESPEPASDGRYRRCRSQFTDTDGYKQHGTNTFHDETGVYGNSDYKKTLTTNTTELPPEFNM